MVKVNHVFTMLNVNGKKMNKTEKLVVVFL